MDGEAEFFELLGRESIIAELPPADPQTLNTMVKIFPFSVSKVAVGVGKVFQ